MRYQVMHRVEPLVEGYADDSDAESDDGPWLLVDTVERSVLSAHRKLSQAYARMDVFNTAGPTADDVANEMRATAAALVRFSALYDGNGPDSWPQAAERLRAEADHLEKSGSLT